MSQPTHTAVEPAYRVVVNDEEQYSIWPDHKEIPPGWHDAGKTASKAACLAYIDEVWTDMRPRSARRADPEPTKLAGLIADFLGVPTAEIADDTGSGGHPAWTSLKQVQLVAVLEDAYGVSLSHSEIRRLTSVAAIRSTLRAKNADV
jgi:MbtH protein